MSERMVVTHAGNTTITVSRGVRCDVIESDVIKILRPTRLDILRRVVRYYMLRLKRALR